VNKLIVAPLAVMVILAVLAFFGLGTVGLYTYDPDQEQIYINGTETEVNYLSGTESFSFNIFSIEGVMITIVAIVVLGIASGITVVSTGLNAFSTMLVLRSIGLFGLWFALTVMATPILFSDEGDIGIAIYGILSFLFAFGFISDATGGEA